MRKFWLHLAFMLASPAAAFALDCDNAMTQRDMNRCAHEDFLQADEALNNTYGWAVEVAGHWSPDAKVALRDAQRAWIPYRDAACHAEGYLFEGGSMQPLIVSTCLSHLTRRRTEDILELYQEN